MLVALGVLGSIASLIGLAALRRGRVKQLAFERTPWVPLATAAPIERDYKLAVVYPAPGSEEPEEIKGAFVAYLRLANLGREPIWREDIAPANPLRVEVDGARFLDISLAGQRRDVTRIELGDPEIDEEHAVALVTFDFLDHRDGAVIRVLSTGQNGRVRLVGDIIGMPGGLGPRDNKRSRDIGGIAALVAFLVLMLASVAGAAWVVRSVAGSWWDAWVLLLLLPAFLLPIFVLAGIAAILPSTGFPKELQGPDWLAHSLPPGGGTGFEVRVGRQPSRQDALGPWWFYESREDTGEQLNHGSRQE
jgi:hypothetical protein